ncbi:hypothetical protein L6452_42064 [Arctium lappa]|uniref:Uncharacterized protein n=1 Tax=Arctium lappa TaxID=4217 RepID=A0ACB8XIF2_ARCLA|nr:hypothetical protein L6452_42064 [Arctium lappa]
MTVAIGGGSSSIFVLPYTLNGLYLLDPPTTIFYNSSALFFIACVHLLVDLMAGIEGAKDCDQMDEMSRVSTEKEEEVIKKKYGGIVPKKPPLISKDHERAYFDSADWALGKQGVEKPKGPLEALRPKLQPTQQQTRYRKSPCAPTDGEDGNSRPSTEDAAMNE